MAVVYSSAAASAAALYSETFADSSLVSAISLAFSSAGGGDLLADFLLLGAGLLELLERGTTGLVGAQHLVDQFDGFAALALGFLDNVSMFTNELNIKHVPNTTAVSRHGQYPSTGP